MIPFANTRLGGNTPLKQALLGIISRNILVALPVWMSFVYALSPLRWMLVVVSGNPYHYATCQMARNVLCTVSRKGYQLGPTMTQRLFLQSKRQANLILGLPELSRGTAPVPLENGTSAYLALKGRQKKTSYFAGPLFGDTHKYIYIYI